MSSKYWGDEKHPDALYAVYLKKVRYVPPPGYDGAPRYRPLDPDRVSVDGEMGADHLQWESVKERVIKAGTVDKLVECLVGVDDTMDSHHFHVFFATFRAFTEPIVVLDMLLRRYEDLESEVNGSTSALVIQNSIRCVLICWLDKYPEDYYDPQSSFAMLTNLLHFAQRSRLTDLHGKAQKLKRQFGHIWREGGMISKMPSLKERAHAFGYTDAEHLNDPQMRVKMFDVGKENCVQIAEQLTFWDAMLFKEVMIHQCQGAAWSTRYKSDDKVYTVKATINQFNDVCARVMTSIVLPECRPDFRAKIISKWIDIARELRALKNFSSLKAVISTLQSAPVHRLSQTWALISSRSMTQFKELRTIFDTDSEGDENNVRKLLDKEGTAKSSPLRRPELIKNCHRTKSDVNLAECQGTVPYLGSFLTDLAMLDQATPDKIADLINFDKRRKEFDILARIRLLQSAARAYKIPMDHVFCAWFHYLPALSENECFQRSLEIEKAPLTTTPDISHRLNTSSLSNGRGNDSVQPKSSIMRFFTPRQSDDSPTRNHSSHHSHSHSQSSGHSLPVPGPSSGSPPLMGQSSSDSGFQCEDWINGSVDGGPPGRIPLCGTLPRSGKVHRNGDTSTTTTSTTTTNGCGGSLTYKSGQSFLGCEFSPGFVFPRGMRESLDSTQEVNTSISGRSSIDMGGSYSASNTPQRDSLNGTFDSLHIGGGGRHQKKSSDASSCSSSSQNSQSAAVLRSFHLARVGLDDELQTGDSGANYKSIKVENGDRMAELIERALEKHLLEDEADKYCLIQLLPDGREFQLPDRCNPYYAMVPDESSPMLNMILRKQKAESETGSASPHMGPAAKKLNKAKRSHLLRWSSGYL